MEKSKNAKTAFETSSTTNITQERAFNIIELRSCRVDTPRAKNAGIPSVRSAPTAIIHRTRTKSLISKQAYAKSALIAMATILLILSNFILHKFRELEALEEELP